MTDDLAAAAAVLQRGGVVLLPTDTIYGLHALATDATAIGKIIEVKERDDGKPFVVLVASLTQANALGVRIPDNVRRILDELWPGPLTAILPLDKPIAASRNQLAIALRLPALDWLRELIAQTGPLVSTSANRSGEKPVFHPNELAKSFRSKLDLVVDRGPLEGKPSTLVDFSGDEPRVLREGESFFTQKVWKTLRKTL